MHQFLGPNDLAPKNFADRLMTKTDPEDRQFAGKAADDFFTDAGVIGPARPGRDEQASRFKLFDLLNGDLIVAIDLNFCADLAQILHEIVGEGVVIIDHQNHVIIISRMKARIITYPERELWNEFVANSPECPILQSFEWGELKARYGWQPIRLAIEENDKLIAGISILKKEIPYIRHSLFYAPRGPVVDFSNRQLLEFLLEAVEKEADKHHALSLKVDPDLPEGENILPALGAERALKQVQPRATLLIDLAPDLESILMSFEEKTRYNVRLAEKKGVSVKEEAGEIGLNQFYNLYKETAARDKFLIHPISYYQSIRELLFEKGLGTCFIAYHNSRPIAGVIIFCFGRKVWYMYGASASSSRNLMPNHLLHWEVIKWAKAKGYQLYDLWGIPAKLVPEHPLWGVYRFKKGFNGRTVKYVGAYDFPYSPLFYHLFEHGLVWWQGLRSLVTKGKIEDSLAE